MSWCYVYPLILWLVDGDCFYPKVYTLVLSTILIIGLRISSASLPYNFRKDRLNSAGREIEVTLNRLIPAGSQQIEWNGTNSAWQTVGNVVYFID